MSRAEYQRAWNAKNKDKKAAYHKAWVAKNPERAAEARRRATAKHYQNTGKASRKRWRDKNPELVSAQYRRWKLKSTYGLTPEQWDRMFEAQNKTCASCGEAEPGGKKGWVVDHCHQTGVVRGIICHRCNIGLGIAKDDVQTLRKWIKYLQKTKSSRRPGEQHGAVGDHVPSVG